LSKMQTVNIPAHHFAQQTTNIYAKPLQAWIRETVQNENDAGATHIVISAKDNEISIYGNGCGMTEQVLLEGMLTMSGSIKEEGATGGFGAAKELILFAQDSYEIETNDLYAYGSCLNYMLDRKEFKQGTKITIVPHELFKYNKMDFVSKAITYLEDCELECEITVNDHPVNFKDKGTLFRELDWGKVYMKESPNTTKMRIRHNGLLMFDRLVAETKYALTIELKGDSPQILTTSRDSLRYLQAQELDDLILELQKAGNDFGRLFNHEVTYRGRKSFIQRIEDLDIHYDTQDLYSKVIDFVPPEIHDTTSVVEQTAILDKVCASVTVPDEVKESIEKLKDVIDGVTEHDFKIRIDKAGYDEVPQEIRPSEMKKKYDLIAKWWKATFQEIGRVTNYTISDRYAVGFVLSDEVTGLFAKEDGFPCYYINPYSEKFIKLSSNTESQYNLLVVACHEAAHTMTKYHEASWQQEFQTTLMKMMAHSNISRIKKIAKDIQI